jgi:hypothetical protein
LKQLAAISIMMLCFPFTEGQRVGRYGRILVDLSALVDGKKPPSALTNLTATTDELNRVEQNLMLNAYALRNVKAFLLWSETLVGDGGRSIEAGNMTVEHLLPNTPGSETYWISRFPGEKWEQYANQIGNLVLVSARMNGNLSRKDFIEKKAMVANRVKAGWIITDKALESTDWTSQVIEERGHELLKKAKTAMKNKVS